MSNNFEGMRVGARHVTGPISRQTDFCAKESNEGYLNSLKYLNVRRVNF